MNRLSDEKANAIAAEYLTNGMQKVKALLSIGYAKSYANHVGLKLFDNAKVKQAISRIQARNSARTAYTVGKAEKEYEEARLLAIQLNQPASAVSATTGKARLYGMDRDAGTAIETPKQLSPERIKELEELLSKQYPRITKVG